MRRQGNVNQSSDAWDARIAKACGTYPAGVDNLLALRTRFKPAPYPKDKTKHSHLILKTNNGIDHRRHFKKNGPLRGLANTRFRGRLQGIYMDIRRPLRPTIRP